MSKHRVVMHKLTQTCTSCRAAWTRDSNLFDKVGISTSSPVDSLMKLEDGDGASALTAVCGGACLAGLGVFCTSTTKGGEEEAAEDIGCGSLETGMGGARQSIF